MISTAAIRRRLVASTVLCSGLLFAATPSAAQNTPGNVLSSRVAPGGQVNVTATPTAATITANRNAIINWSHFVVDADDTVNFRHGDGAAAPKIAIVNRVTSASTTMVSGRLNSDPNVTVVLLNPNGVIFQSGSQVNVGSLVASSLNIRDEDDFLANGATRLAFQPFMSSGIPPSELLSGQVYVSGRSGALAPASINASGDVILVAPRVAINGNSNDGGTVVAGNDVAVVSASRASFQLGNGPISMTLASNAPGGAGLSIGGSVSGRNVTFAMYTPQGATDNFLSAYGVVTATAASATDRGIVLAAGTEANGVEFRDPFSATPDQHLTSGRVAVDSSGGFAYQLRTVSANSAWTPDVEIRSNYYVNLPTLGSISSAGDVSVIASGAGSGLLLSNVSAARGLMARSQGDLALAGTSTIAGAVTLDAAGATGNVRLGDLTGATAIDIVHATDVVIAGRVVTPRFSFNAARDFLSDGNSAAILETDYLTGSAGRNIGLSPNTPYYVLGAIGDLSAVSGGITLRTRSDVNLVGAISAAGDIALGTVDAPGGSDLTIGAGGTIAGRSVTLNVAGNFINRRGADAVAVASGQRWIVSIADPDDNVYGGLDSQNEALWGAATNPAGSPGNRYHFRITPQLTFTPFLRSGRKNYGDTLDNASFGYNYEGLRGSVAGAYIGDDNILSVVFGTPLYSSAGTAANADVGQYSIALSGIGSSKYGIAFRPGSFAIDPRLVDIFATIARRQYDGTTAATASSWSYEASRILAGDIVQIDDIRFAFANENAGTRDVITTVSASGADAANYRFVSAPTLAGIIDPRRIFVNATVANKIYDGTAQASGSVTGIDGILAQDQNSYGLSDIVFAFANKNAGIGKAISLSATATGADAGNYTFELRPTVADITPRGLGVTASVRGKTYDGTAAANGTVTGFTNAVQGDDLHLDDVRFAFADKNAGTGKAVALSATLAGGDAGNYTVTLPGDLVADIARRALGVTASINGKVYDGTTTANGTVTGFTNAVQGDELHLDDVRFAFADKNAGAGKAVVLSATFAGGDARNYTLTLPADLFADIARRAVGVTASASGKVYDGTATANGTVSGFTNAVQGDDLRLDDVRFAFADKNAGAGKAVTLSALLAGGDAGNYTLTLPADLVADIARRALGVTASATGKVYDGTATASGAVTGFTNAVQGDDLHLDDVRFAFADKNAGAGKAVALSATLAGGDAGNYTLTLPADLVADIARRALGVTASVDGKTYDGSTAANGTVTGFTNAVQGDELRLDDLRFAFADRNAGAGKAVALSATLAGNDAGNYILTLPVNLTANISRRVLGVTVSVDGKTYNGNTTASGTVTGFTNAVQGDDLHLADARFAFADKHAGAGKAVSMSATLTGGDAGNYLLTLPTDLVADIARRALGFLASADGKVYDGTTAATGSVSNFINGVQGDDLHLDDLRFTFADKNAGTEKKVFLSATLGGNDAGNYTLTLPVDLEANITRRSITVRADDASKTQGAADPTFGWRTVAGSLVAGEGFDGGLSRQPGEAPGAYDILQGTLRLSSNYDLRFEAGRFHIEGSAEEPAQPRAPVLPDIYQSVDVGAAADLRQDRPVLVWSGALDCPADPLQTACGEH